MLILTTLLRRIICFWNVVRVELRDGYVISRSYWFGKWERKNKGYVVKTDAIVYFDTAMSIWGKSVSFGGFVKKEKDNNLYVNFDGVDYLQFYNMDIVGLNLNNVDKIKVGSIYSLFSYINGQNPFSHVSRLIYFLKNAPDKCHLPRRTFYELVLA